MILTSRTLTAYDCPDGQVYNPAGATPVPTCLDKDPLGPFSNQPLRFGRSYSGPVIYNVGEDDHEQAPSMQEMDIWEWAGLFFQVGN